MQNKLFLKAADVCELLEVSTTSAYEIIANLNSELEKGIWFLKARFRPSILWNVFTGLRMSARSHRRREWNGSMRKRKMYLSVEDVAEVFDISVSFAYRVVERMNADLASKNYYVILGRVPTRYVEDKIYGLEHVEQYLSEEKAI